MRCPLCDSQVKVLSVRDIGNGKRRRYQCVNGHRFSTVERIDPHTVDSLDEYEMEESEKSA